MPSIPVRELGAVGIVKDVNPFNLPPNAFSDGMNVRFDNNKVQRSPIFRKMQSGLTGTVPVFCYGVYNPTSFDSVIYANNDGRLFSVANATEVSVSEAGHVNNVDPRPYTGTSLAQCVYLNRPDIAPRVLVPNTTNFVSLPNWPAGWVCNALRSFKSFLMAINLTKGGVSFPNLVNWSDAAPNGSYPGSWDVTDTTKLAGQNVLSQIATPLVDGGPLGENFMLYSKDAAILVEFTGDALMFDWRRLPFDNAGIINQNCWIEINGEHFVWGENDIYAHNGVSKRSIIDQRNRERFFRELNIKKAGVFYIAHDKYRHEIIFCGVSGSANAKFVNPNGYCNYGAVYNYLKDTWSFMDLPNSSAATTANANTVWTYATVPVSLTYENVGGSYFDQEDSFSRYCVMTSVADTPNGLSTALHVLDAADQGKLALALDSATVATAWVQRTGFDLDQVGAELRGYKQVRALMPQVSLFVTSAPLTVQMGAHLVSSSAVVWETAQTFDPTTDYKIDTKAGGRYIAYQFQMPTAHDFEVPGYDIDVMITGRR